MASVIVIAKLSCSLRVRVTEETAEGPKLRTRRKVTLTRGRNVVDEDVVLAAMEDPATAGWFGKVLKLEDKPPPPPPVPAVTRIPGVGPVFAPGDPRAKPVPPPVETPVAPVAADVDVLAAPRVSTVETAVVPARRKKKSEEPSGDE
jgi:hypothetical protein